jgi:glycosyltransferase involved in cell wall biosynthesis
VRVLLANHHLADRAGSELYTLELANALARRGHQVGVFTFFEGPIAEELRRDGIRLFSLGEEPALEAFAPEVLHVHHAPCLYYLGALRLHCPAIHSVLGTAPALEAPPSYWGGVTEGLAVSE